MARLALYGNVGIIRVFCQDCQRMALVVQDIKQCCNQPSEEDINGSERVSQPELLRRSPTPKQRIEILKRQHDCCLYCGRRFGSSVWYKGKLITLRTNYDHVLPLDYAFNNDIGNFVAACHVCNHWKATRIFNYLEEIQVYVTERWERVNTDVGKNLPGMRGQVSE